MLILMGCDRADGLALSAMSGGAPCGYENIKTERNAMP